MKQIGRVVAQRPGNLALVSLSAAESCGSCSTRSICRGLTLTGRKRCREALVQNSLQAQVGSRVELELRPAATIAAITSTFLLPVLGVVAGYVVGAPRGLAPGAIGAGVGLGLGILLSILINRMLARRPGFQLQMTRVVEEGTPDEKSTQDAEEPGKDGYPDTVPGGEA